MSSSQNQVWICYWFNEDGKERFDLIESDQNEEIIKALWKYENKKDNDKTFGCLYPAHILNLNESEDNIQKSILYSMEEQMKGDLIRINGYYKLRYGYKPGYKNTIEYACQKKEQYTVVKNTFQFIYKKSS